MSKGGKEEKSEVVSKIWLGEFLVKKWRRRTLLSMMDFGGWQQGSGAHFQKKFCRCSCGILEELPSNQAMFARWH